MAILLSYSLGRGVEKDHKQAFHWYRLAAEQGYENAQMCMFIACFSGVNAEKNDKQAFYWCRLAAEQGNGMAQYFMGLFYKRGVGCEQNDEQSDYWFELAAEQGFEGDIEDVMNQINKLIAKHESPVTAEILKFPEKQNKDVGKIKEGLINAIEEHLSVYDLLNSFSENKREDIFMTLKYEFKDVDLNNYSIKHLLEAGEGRTIEYKETFSFNTREKKKIDVQIRHAFLREVAAFLNTEGGVVLVGVSDDKRVTGIECDDFEDSEKYMRTISLVIADALGEGAATLTRAEIHEHDGGKICAVTCKKSIEPVYCNYKKFGEEAFVRIGSIVREPPKRELASYCKHRFQ